MEENEKSESVLIKCHKCRYVLIKDVDNILNLKSCDTYACDNYDFKRFIYFYDEKVPPWIRKRIEEEQWTKGKLHCENCRCKVGSFDFITGRKCECGLSVLPSVHFISSQVDIPVQIMKLLNK